VLDIWTDTYVNLAGPVLAARIAAVDALSTPAPGVRDLVADSPAQDVARLPVLRYELSHGRSVDGRTGQRIPDPATSPRSCARHSPVATTSCGAG
jgi:DNA replication and repair protein RecF